MPIGMTPTMSASWGSGGNDFVANPLSIVAVGMNPIGMQPSNPHRHVRTRNRPKITYSR